MAKAKSIKYPTIQLFSTEHGKQIRITEVNGTTYISASDFAIRSGILVNSVRNYYRKLPLSFKRMIRLDDPRTTKPLLMLTLEELSYLTALIGSVSARQLYNDVAHRIAVLV